jgi:hypothetical protein
MISLSRNSLRSRPAAAHSFQSLQESRTCALQITLFTEQQQPPVRVDILQITKTSQVNKRCAQVHLKQITPRWMGGVLPIHRRALRRRTWPIEDPRNVFEVLPPKLKTAAEKSDMFSCPQHEVCGPSELLATDSQLPGSLQSYFLQE